MAPGLGDLCHGPFRQEPVVERQRSADPLSARLGLQAGPDDGGDAVLDRIGGQCTGRFRRGQPPCAPSPSCGADRGDRAAGVGDQFPGDGAACPLWRGRAAGGDPDIPHRLRRDRRAAQCAAHPVGRHARPRDRTRARADCGDCARLARRRRAQRSARRRRGRGATRPPARGDGGGGGVGGRRSPRWAPPGGHAAAATWGRRRCCGRSRQAAS